MNDICIMQYVLDNNTGEFAQVRGKRHAKRIHGRMKRKGGDPHNLTVHVGVADSVVEGSRAHLNLRPTRVTDESGTTIHTF